MKAIPPNLNRLAYFAAVVESGSFTRAAKRLGITKAVVSSQVAKLEAELGAALLLRTTRQVRPTEAGQTFFEQCRSILDETDQAFRQVEEATAAPTGTLKVTAPLDYGMAVVTPAAVRFAARFPACQVVLRLDDRTIDLLSENIDLAVRVGWLAGSGSLARRIGAFQQMLVRRAGMAPSIASPVEVEASSFVANAALREPLRWTFTGSSGAQASIQFKPTITVDATPAAHAAVLAGAGLSVLPDFLIAPDILSGRLEHVLPSWTLPEGGIYAVFPQSRFRPPKVRAFIDVLLESERAQRR